MYPFITLITHTHTCILHAQGGISKHDIQTSGIYVLLMAMCDANALPVVLDGDIESIDPCE